MIVRHIKLNMTGWMKGLVLNMFQLFKRHICQPTNVRQKTDQQSQMLKRWK